MMNWTFTREEMDALRKKRKEYLQKKPQTTTSSTGNSHPIQRFRAILMSILAQSSLETTTISLIASTNIVDSRVGVTRDIQVLTQTLYLHTK